MITIKENTPASTKNEFSLVCRARHFYQLLREPRYYLFIMIARKQNHFRTQTTVGENNPKKLKRVAGNLGATRDASLNVNFPLRRSLDLSGDPPRGKVALAVCSSILYNARGGLLFMRRAGADTARFCILDSHDGQPAQKVFCTKTNLASRKSDIHDSVGAEINLTYCYGRSGHWRNWSHSFFLQRYILGLMLFYSNRTLATIFLLFPVDIIYIGRFLFFEKQIFCCV